MTRGSPPVAECPSHLDADTAVLLAESPDKRIEAMEHPVWIGYTYAVRALAQMERLFQHARVPRMPSLLVVGDTNNGKTQILEAFLRAHPPSDNPEGDAIHFPVLDVVALPSAAEARLYHSILDRLGAMYRHSANIDDKRRQTITLMSAVGVRMLIIDEIQQVLTGGSTRQQEMLNTIKLLSNALRIPIVGFGTESAFHAIQSDPQLGNRFKLIQLPSWKLDPEYRTLLACFERLIPLKEASGLANNPTLARQILDMSNHTIGEIASILVMAAEEAIRTGTERIDLGLLRTIDWIVPADRRLRE